MIKTYYFLTKPGIIFGNIVTTFAGFTLASQGEIHFLLLAITLLGLGLVIASAGIFNNYIDRESDGKMTRTQNRPLVRGLISPHKALIFAALLGLLGSYILFEYTNGLTLGVALFGFFVYLVLYAFLKYRSFHGTLVGGLAGAVPPVVGYTAVSGQLDSKALLLFTWLLLWQMPHFYAIALYRLEEYKSASIPVLPLVKGLKATQHQITLYILAFILCTSLFTFLGFTDLLYLKLTLLLGAFWLGLSLWGYQSKNPALWGRQMFISSLIVIFTLCIFLPITLWAAPPPDVASLLEKHRQEEGIPGLVACVVQEGKTEFHLLGLADRERSLPVTRDTLFNLASVTKVFLTTALAQEVLEKHILLEAPVKTYIPELKRGPLKSFGQVKVIDLATHRASLPRNPPFKPVKGKYQKQEIFHFLRNWQAPYPVGSKYAYSNLSFGILGMTLVESQHHPLQAILHETIFTPLQMTETHFNVPPQQQNLRAIGYLKTGKRSPHFQPNLWPDGGSLNSSISDMSRFLLATMGLEGPEKLKKAMNFAQKSLFQSNERLSVGLGWQIFQSDGVELIEKDGGVSGYSCYIGFTQDRKFGLVILTNKGHAKLPPFARKLLQLMYSRKLFK